MAVLKVVEAFKKYGNPFSSNLQNSELHNIVTGTTVCEENKADILNARDIGFEGLQDYVDNIFAQKLKSFWHPIKKLKLNTFSSQLKPLIIGKDKEKMSVLKTQQNIFARLLSVSRTRYIDLKEVLQYELTSLPLSLFHMDGTMRKTVKCNLLKELELESVSVQSISDSVTTSCSAIDFMVLVQSISNSSLKTFGDLATYIENLILACFKDSSSLIVVPDRYDVDQSIKSHERNRRQQTTVNETKILRDDQEVPKLQMFLKSQKNKSSLIDYIFHRLKSTVQSKLRSRQEITLCFNDGSAIKFTNTSSETLDFRCDHEEADSKMFVYLHHASLSTNIKRIIINSPDTDVAVIACYQLATSFQHVPEMWFKTGTGSKKRFIPIHDVVERLGTTLCKTLPVFHSITGCDSTSSFSRIGKKKAFGILKSHSPQLLGLLDFGDDPNLMIDSESSIDAMKLVCLLYDDNSQTADVNTLRFKLFTKKGISGEKLPPTVDSLVQHLRRANYQAFIWKNATQGLLNLPSPCGNGWKLDDITSILTHEYMLQQPIPESMVELVRCKCKKACSSKSCSCRKSNLSCTDVCLGSEEDKCLNIKTYFSDSDEEDDI